MSVINIAIVEDEPDVRDSIKNLIDMHDRFYCVGAFDSAESFMQKFSSLNVDVVLMDITLPNMNGVQCILTLKPKRSSVQYLICTSHEDTDRIFDSLCAGASGYLLKGITTKKLLEAITEVYHGGSPMSPQIARKVINSFPVKNQNQSLLQTLTPREKEILNALAKGYQYKQIADQLFLSVETIRTYIRKIYDKLQVHSRTEALNKLFTKE